MLKRRRWLVLSFLVFGILWRVFRGARPRNDVEDLSKETIGNSLNLSSHRESAPFDFNTTHWREKLDRLDRDTTKVAVEVSYSTERGHKLNHVP